MFYNNCLNIQLWSIYISDHPNSCSHYSELMTILTMRPIQFITESIVTPKTRTFIRQYLPSNKNLSPISNPSWLIHNASQISYRRYSSNFLRLLLTNPSYFVILIEYRIFSRSSSITNLDLISLISNKIQDSPTHTQKHMTRRTHVLTCII